MIIKEGQADKVLFVSLETEEVMEIRGPHVVVHDTGVICVTSPNEDLILHIINCEVVWKEYNTGGDRIAKVSHLRPVS